MAEPAVEAGLPGNPEVEAPKDEQKMIVFGVSYSTTKEGFRDYFASFGEVLECELMFNREGRSRGFGFVLFKDEAINKQVLGMQHSLDGRNLDVKLRDTQTYGRDRGGFGGGPGPGARPEERPAASRTKIFIGRLNDEVTQEDLREYFEQYGTITDVFMPTNHATGKTKNCGFVEFAAADSASSALEETRHMIKGSEASVQAAEPKEARGGGRGGFGGGRGGYGGDGFGGMGGYGGGDRWGDGSFNRGDFSRDRFGGDRFGRERMDERDRRFDERMIGMGRPEDMMRMGGYEGMPGMDQMWGMGEREMWMMYDRIREMYERGGGGMEGGFPPFMGGAAMPGGMAGGAMGGGWGGAPMGGGGGRGGGGRARVMVDGLPRGMQWQGLKDLFKQFGTLRADVTPDGVGCVTFDDPNAARSAVGAMNGFRVENGALRVYME